MQTNCSEVSPPTTTVNTVTPHLMHKCKNISTPFCRFTLWWKQTQRLRFNSQLACDLSLCGDEQRKHSTCLCCMTIQEVKLKLWKHQPERTTRRESEKFAIIFMDGIHLSHSIPELERNRFMVSCQTYSWGIWRFQCVCAHQMCGWAKGAASTSPAHLVLFMSLILVLTARCLYKY